MAEVRLWQWILRSPRRDTFLMTAGVARECLLARYAPGRLVFVRERVVPSERAVASLAAPLRAA